MPRLDHAAGRRGSPGILFARPAKLSLPFDAGRLPDGALASDQQVYELTDEGPRLAGEPALTDDAVGRDGDLVEPTVEAGTGLISFPIGHTGRFAAGVCKAVDYAFETVADGPDALRVLRAPLEDEPLRERGSVRFVVLHHTGSAQTLRTQLGHARQTRFSAHFYVSEGGVIGQAADAAVLRYHAGSPVDERSVGVSLCTTGAAPYPAAQVLALRRLLDYLSGRFDIPLRGRHIPYFGGSGRAVDHRFVANDAANPGGNPEAFERVLTHREVDAHRWVVRARFPQDRSADATTLHFTSNWDGRFCRASVDDRCLPDTADARPFGVEFAVPLAESTGVIFEPDNVETRDAEITVAAEPVDDAGTSRGPSNSVRFRLDYAPSAAEEWAQGGPAATQPDQPYLVASRRRHDAGGTAADYELPLVDITASLRDSFTGIVDTSGGDAFIAGLPGQGGAVTIEAGHSFAEDAFAEVEGAVLDGSPARSVVVQAGAMETLAAGSHQVVWLVVDGELQLEGAAEVSALGGVYVGPAGRIVARDPTGAERDGFGLTLETAGEALIFGAIDAAGTSAPAVDDGAAGGRGGEVTIRMRAAGHTLVPTIISRGGDGDTAMEAAAPAPASPPGGAGGAVLVRALGEGARVVLGGGAGAGGAPPVLPVSELPLPPPFNVGTPEVERPEHGQRIPLVATHWSRGILTTGGLGGASSRSGINAAPGGPGGPGGAVVVEADELTADGVTVWTGTGLERIIKRIWLHDDDHDTLFPGVTGGTGGTGGLGGVGRGGDGGAGGDAGSVTFSGRWVPELAAAGRVAIQGWDNANANFDSIGRLGELVTYEGGLPIGGDGARPLPIISVTAVGGSGGFPGGSTQSFPGWFGVRGADGTIDGLP